MVPKSELLGDVSRKLPTVICRIFWVGTENRSRPFGEILLFQEQKSWEIMDSVAASRIVFWCFTDFGCISKRLSWGIFFSSTGIRFLIMLISELTLDSAIINYLCIRALEPALFEYITFLGEFPRPGDNVFSPTSRIVSSFLFFSKGEPSERRY